MEGKQGKEMERDALNLEERNQYEDEGSMDKTETKETK